jgi:hypothetical protein
MTPAFQAVAALIGEANAMTLTERLGGAPVYVPEVPLSGSPLVLAVGHGPAARLCDAFAGQRLHLPSRSVVECARRRAAILYDLRRGLATVEIARRYGLTARQIQRIRVQEKP